MVVAVLKAFAIQLSLGAGNRIVVCVSLALPHLKRKEVWIDLTPRCLYPRSNTSLSQEKRKLQHTFIFLRRFSLGVGLHTCSGVPC